MDEQKDLKKWWLYIDGDLTPEQKAEFQKELAADQELASILLESERLDQGLSQIEAEEPSMRFSKNVVDNLPQLYKKVRLEPIFSRKTIATGLVTLSFAIVLTYLSAILGESPQTTGPEPIWMTYFEQWTSLPQTPLSLIAIISFCIISVFLIDRLIKRQFLMIKK